jgi:ectoine hydroxylase-related dioxygenase (phytanoyl-CoA dioxygenase family)
VNQNASFNHDDLDRALACMDRLGYCVIRKMIEPDTVEDLKKSVDEHLDPDRNLPPASNRYHMTFAEASEPLWKLIDHPPFMNYVHRVHGTSDDSELCLHRSAAILRTPGEGMGGWHTDHRAHIAKPQIANEVLNRFKLPSGSWLYLNGSHPDRSGLAVIAGSHVPDWEGPDGFELTPDRNSFHPIGDEPDAGYNKLDVPGCVPIVSEPGDMVCFASRTYHANMATNERRYACGFGFRPKRIRIDTPWPLPDAAKALRDRLPEHLKHFTDGYTSYDGQWRAPEESD